jgi:hypothetical protein
MLGRKPEPCGPACYLAAIERLIENQNKLLVAQQELNTTNTAVLQQLNRTETRLAETLARFDGLLRALAAPRQPELSPVGGRNGAQ